MAVAYRSPEDLQPDVKAPVRALPEDVGEASSSRIMLLGVGYAGLRCVHALGAYLGTRGAPKVVLEDPGQVLSLGSASGVSNVFLPLAGRKVAALKALIQEGYRFEITGRLPFFDRQDHGQGQVST